MISHSLRALNMICISTIPKFIPQNDNLLLNSRLRFKCMHVISTCMSKRHVKLKSLHVFKLNSSPALAFLALQHLSIFPFVVCAFSVISKKLLSCPNVMKLLPILSSKNFIVLPLMLRSLINFKLILPYNVR